MKILAVSDYVNADLTIPPGCRRLFGVELILSCGDLAPEYLASLAQACGAPLYYVRGNHDIRSGLGGCPGCIDIHAQVLNFAGLTILGLEGSHWYNGGPLQYKESQMRVLVRQAAAQLRRFRSLDIVVAHAAPRGIGDCPDPCHRGFRSFRHLIDRFKPRFFLHGHIHQPSCGSSERVTVVGPTQVINCSGHYLFEVNDASPPA